MPRHSTLSQAGSAGSPNASLAHTHPGSGFEFPVGYILISSANVNPLTFLGYGVWTNIGAGQVPVGLDTLDSDFNTALETGGSKTVASSAQTFAGNALGTHQHAAVSAGTPAGTNAAEATHTHTYTQVPNHVHGVSTILRTATTGAATTQVTNAQDTSSTADTTRKTDNPDGGVATGTSAAGLSHNHVFTGNALGTHQHDAITAGTPAGTNTPGAATSVVQPYFVVYWWHRDL